MNLNELATEYRKTKSPKLLNEIFQIIQPNLKKKAKFIYYKMWRRKDSKGRFIDNEGLLVRSGLVDYIDVEQELNLDILKLINKFNTSIPFEAYLKTMLYYWKPSFVNQDFFVRAGFTVSGDEEMDEEGHNRFDFFVKEENKPILEIAPLDERENQILDELMKNPDTTQEELGKILKVSQGTISLTLIELRKKIKYYS